MKSRIARQLVAKSIKPAQKELTVERKIVRTIDRTADGDLGDRPQFRQHPAERGIIGDCTRGASKPRYKLRHANSAAVLRRERVWLDELTRWFRANPTRINPRYTVAPTPARLTSASGHILGQWPIGEIRPTTQSRVNPATEWTPDQLRIIRATAAMQITNEHATVTGDILSARAIVAEIDSRPERQQQAAAVRAARRFSQELDVRLTAENATDHALVSRILTGTAPASSAPASGIVARFRFQSVPLDAPMFAYTPRVPLSALVPLARPKVMTAGRY